MNRSLFALPLIALCAVLAVIATMVATPTAHAQEGTNAALSLHVSEASVDQPFRTVAVALDPGQSELAALGATLTFDVDDVIVNSCAISEAGACNVVDDQIMVSVFNLALLQANEQLLTVDFELTSDAVSSTTFAIESTTAITNQGTPVEGVTGDRVEIQLVAPTFGSLTGSVVDATSTAGIFDLDVCVISDATAAQTCTTTTGLGTWRLDDLATGTYAVVIDDGTGTYQGVVASGFVTEDEVSVVAESALVFVTETVVDAEETIDESSSDVAVTDTAGDTSPAEVVIPTAPIAVEYEASIEGRVTGLATETAIVAAQVCATQPLVLHQSCATTDANGEFTLVGLSTGNYWVEVVDPLGQFEQTRPKLVGVVGNDATRAGVNIALASVAE